MKNKLKETEKKTRRNWKKQVETRRNGKKHGILKETKIYWKRTKRNGKKKEETEKNWKKPEAIGRNKEKK